MLKERRWVDLLLERVRLVGCFCYVRREEMDWLIAGPIMVGGMFLLSY